jgi:hypothetical protein
VSTRTQTERGALEIIEEAFHLLRMAPLSLLLTYYLGAVPFVLGLLFFWSDMSRGAFADDRLAMETVTLAILFVWMKTWQAFFSRQLTGQITGRPPDKLTLTQIVGGIVTQTILQPSGLFLIPLAVLLLFPIAWVYSFYQNVTALGGFDDPRKAFAKAARYSMTWPRQNHYIVFLFKGFGFFVFLNVVAGVVAVPFLLATLLGIETVFVQSPWTFLNTTFFAAICAVTYLCVDPVVKAVYTVRCFYADSRETGEDLKSELRSFVPAVQKAAALGTVAAALFFGSVSAGRAADTAAKPPASNAAAPAVRPNELNTTIEQVMQRPEYTWRLPREKHIDKKEKGAIASFVDGILQWIVTSGKKVRTWIDQLAKWLRPRTSTNPSTGSRLGLDWLFGVQGLILLLVVVVAGLLVFLLVRLWRYRDRAGVEEVAAQAIIPVPDLTDEDVAADQLPEDGWITMARDLLSRGDLRLALRAFYLATLAHLAQRNLVTIARHKSNRDYERELGRRAHALPELTSRFNENVSIFDRIWYGMHEVNEALLEHFQRNVERIKTS